MSLPAHLLPPVRHAVVADSAALATLEARCFSSDLILAVEYEALITDPDSTVLMIGEAEPYAALALQDRPAADEVYIYSLAVCPLWRRRGLARRLLAAAVEQAHALGRSRIVLEVRPDNAPALILYRDEGFALERRVAAWFEDGADAVRMSRPVVLKSRVRGHRPVPPKVMVVTGGAAGLRPSSSASVRSLQAALDKAGLEGEIRALDGARECQADAAILRTFTEVGGPAHRLAQQFEAAGKPVLDRPASILRGCDKIHQAMVLGRVGLPTPNTRLIGSLGHLEAATKAIGTWPIIVKDPAGSFCNGIEIAADPEQLLAAVIRRLDASASAILQEFVASSFDWRIGVLDDRPLFAARYWMAPGSWKIRDEVNGASRWGRAEGVPLSAVPTSIFTMATAAARAMGPGLWGVDLKLGPAGPVVIEVNDNPNIDDDVEAACDPVWPRLANWFAGAIERARPTNRFQAVSAA